MEPILGHVERLRATLTAAASGGDLQILYERWLKQDSWRVRDEGLPLLVGCDPSHWAEFLETHGLTANEEILWQLLSNDLQVTEHDSVAVSRLVSWANKHEITLQPSFARIYEFVRKVLLSDAASPPEAEPQHHESALHPENEIVLGAALSLVSKMPDRCRDSDGFIDGSAVAALIFEMGARWFPASGPAMNAEQMAALIDKWLE